MAQMRTGHASSWTKEGLRPKSERVLGRLTNLGCESRKCEMEALLVTSFFDIGRGLWQSLSRSQEKYFNFYRHYLARLPAPRYFLADAISHEKIAETIDFADVAEFDEIYCYRFLEPTRAVMNSAHFRSMFCSSDDLHHIEHILPQYNVAMMAKWDALERAAAMTNNTFSHYVWIDFGIGGGAGGWLPEPSGFSPIVRDKIVFSAQRLNRRPPLYESEIRYRIQHFIEQVAGSMMIVPASLLSTFASMARRNYKELLDMNLATDDQVISDMCIAERPELFHLSYAPRGLTKFNHIHNVINGLDAKQPRAWEIPIFDRLTRKRAARKAREMLGL